METFEIAAKKKRRHNRWLTVGISVLTVGALMIGGKFVSSKLISKQAWEVVETVELLESVAYPNASTYTWGANGGDFFTGGIKGKRVKDIFGVPVYHSDYTAHFSWFAVDWGNTLYSDSLLWETRGVYKVDLGQKVAQFYNPKAQSLDGEIISQPSQDLTYVKEMKNQLVEVALTFDKPYRLQEIKAMIPTSLKTNWYWIGTETKGDSSSWKEAHLYGASEDELVYLVEEGETPRTFLTNLEAVLEAPGDGEYAGSKPREDIRAYLKKFGKLNLSKEDDLNQLEFSGVIVTGPAEAFADLENQSWVYASSIGSSISQLPYYEIETE